MSHLEAAMFVMIVRIFPKTSEHIRTEKQIGNVLDFSVAVSGGMKKKIRTEVPNFFSPIFDCGDRFLKILLLPFQFFFARVCYLRKNGIFWSLPRVRKAK